MFHKKYYLIIKTKRKFQLLLKKITLNLLVILVKIC